MKLLYKYIVYTLILIVSFLSAWLLPLEATMKGIVAFPGVGVLFLALYQLLRDGWQHDRNLNLQYRQQDFILSTSSHIADVVYDRHVLFCEEYIDRVQKGRQELLRDGASPKALSIGGDLVRIRQKHSAWLTDKIENSLKPFEQALIKIGADEQHLRTTATQDIDDRKRDIIDKLYRSFGLVLGHEKPMNDMEAEIHIDKIIDKIRDILGIKTMTELRSEAICVTLNRLKGH